MPGESLARRGAPRERGGALVVALCATIPLLIAGGTLLVTVVQGRKATESTVAIAQARDVSASGAQDALAQLAVDPNWRGSYQLALNGPLARITVASWESDGVDNDANGMTDDAAEQNFVEIVSHGTTNIAFDAYGFEIARATRHARSITEAIVQTTDLDLVVDQAVYLDDSLSSFVFGNTQFRLDGNDVNLDGSAGPNAALPGLGTPGDPADLLAQLTAGQDACIVGLGGTASVGTVTDVDLSAQMALLGGLASLTWNGPSDVYSGSIGDRAMLTPVIAHAHGDLTLDATADGCGILIVDGDLTVNGDLDFAGLVYVAGAVTFTGVGNSTIAGGLFALGGVTGPDSSYTGLVKVQYCSEALTAVQSKLAGGITLVSWTQR